MEVGLLNEFTNLKIFFRREYIFKASRLLTLQAVNFICSVYFCFLTFRSVSFHSHFLLFCLYRFSCNEPVDTIHPNSFSIQTICFLANAVRQNEEYVFGFTFFILCVAFRYHCAHVQKRNVNSLLNCCCHYASFVSSVSDNKLQITCYLLPQYQANRDSNS